jgi:Tfp pilus assembly protein PilN
MAGNIPWENLTASAALIIITLLLVRWMIGRLTRSLDCLKDTLREQQKLLEEINKNMANRDKIILNHLEHYTQVQERTIEALEKLCRAWEIR